MKGVFKILLIMAGLVAVLHNSLPHFHHNSHSSSQVVSVESIPLMASILAIFELDLGEGHLEHVTRAQQSILHIILPPAEFLGQFAFPFLLLALLFASVSQLRYFQHRRAIPVAKGIRASVRFRPPPVI